jgi:hypothetical protein
MDPVRRDHAGLPEIELTLSGGAWRLEWPPNPAAFVNRNTLGVVVSN